MAVTDRYRGNNLYISWVYSGGTVVVTGDQKEFTVDRSAQMVETSAGSDAARSYLAGLKDAKFGIKAFETAAAGSALLAALKEGTSGTLTWGPQGTATGKPKFSRGAVVESQKDTIPFDAAVMVDIALQASGDWVSDYGAAF